jgi:hypothetical protein
VIAGNCRGLISLSRLEGPANHLFEGFLLSLFPLRSIDRERRAVEGCEAMNLSCEAENKPAKLPEWL